MLSLYNSVVDILPDTLQLPFKAMLSLIALLAIFKILNLVFDMVADLFQIFK